MLYEGYKVYGPYLCIDNRRRIILWKNEINKITISYARYLMELHLNKYLNEDEEVHHKDENTLNDILGNYEIIHSTKHKKLHNSTQVELFICPWCDKIIELIGNKLSNHKRNNKHKQCVGPFCNRSCAGKYNQQFTRY